MKMFKKINSGLWLTASFALFLGTGCNSPSNQDQSANQAVADTIRKEVALSAESQNLLYSLPTPFEATTMLEKAKAGYFFDITNTPDNVVRYSTEISKALNLGIYSADLAYSVTYNRKDETAKFLACTNKLADELGIAGVYDQSLLDKVKKYSDNRDTLRASINRVFGQTNDFLSKNNRNRVAVLIATGAFAEGIFLASALAEVSIRDNSKIIAVLAAQQANYEKLMTILTAYENDQEMKEVAENMARLKSFWTNFGITDGKSIPMGKMVEVVELARSVRDRIVK